MEGVLLTLAIVGWIAALVCTPSAIHGQRRQLMLFLVVFALAITLTPQVVYQPVDHLLGDINVTYFLFHALLIVAIGLLDIIVQQAISPHGLSVARKRLTALATAAIILAQAILFFSSDWRLLSAVGEAVLPRWDFAAYAATTWIAMGIFAVSFAVACLSDLRRQRRPVTRISLILMVLACLGILTYALISTVRAVLGVLYPGDVLPAWALTAYTLALLLSPVSLVTGLALSAAAAGLAAGRKNYRDRALLWRITPLWQRLLVNSPELSIERSLTPLQLLTVRAPGVHLYRRHVEIRDSLMLRPEQTVSHTELATITLAEERTHTLSPTSTPFFGKINDDCTQ